MDKGFNLEEAENFIDNIYQHKFDNMEEILEDGTQVVHLGGLDDIKWTDFECASFTLLRGEQRLKKQVKKQQEVIDKAINDIDLVIELIKQQPTEDDSWILSRLNAFKIILKEVSE